MHVGVHARLEDRDAAELAELGGVRLVAECAGDQHVEVGVGGFAGGGHQVGAGDGAELGADEDAGPAFDAGVRFTFDVASLGADQVARPRSERSEGGTVLAVATLSNVFYATRLTIRYTSNRIMIYSIEILLCGRA